MKPLTPGTWLTDEQSLLLAIKDSVERQAKIQEIAKNLRDKERRSQLRVNNFRTPKKRRSEL